MSDESSVPAINHHAEHPGFAGPTGVVFGLVFLLIGRANAKLAAAIADVSATDHVVDVGCGPGTAARVAARRGARVKTTPLPFLGEAPDSAQPGRQRSANTRQRRESFGNDRLALIDGSLIHQRRVQSDLDRTRCDC